MKYLSLLTLASVLAQSLNRNFTINLLTDDQYLSIAKLPPSEDQTPISYNDPIGKTDYDGVTYSIVGSFNFTELNIGQAFHIDNDLWSVDVSPPKFVSGTCTDHQINMSLAKAGDDITVMSQDVVVGKDKETPTEFGFVQMPSQIPGVNLVMPQDNRVDKTAE
jgi:hypothetical protein